MTGKMIAILPLTSTGVLLVRSREPGGEWSLGIPRATAEAADAKTVLKNMLSVDGDLEDLGEMEDGALSIFRARIPHRSRPRSGTDSDVVAMDFRTFEDAISSGRIGDLATSAAWLRHRLAEGETTRRRKLPKKVDWTPEKIERLTTMWKQGRTSGEIARAVDATRNAVMGRINRLGLTGLGGSEPPLQVDEETRARMAIIGEFRDIFERDPVPGRGGDDALLVVLAALRCERSPNQTARWSGVSFDRVMDILFRYHEEGIWLADDGPPQRWSGEGRKLSMMLDAQIAYGIFRGQKNSSR